MTGLKMMFVLVTLLLILSDLCPSSGLVVKPKNVGGSLDEDPAPGRSPGPPSLSENASNVLDNELMEEDIYGCALKGDSLPGAGVLNLNISHALFKTDTLVPGVVYQVTLTRAREGPVLEFSLTARQGRLPAGHFSPAASCGSRIIRGFLKTEPVTFNWTIDSNNYRPRESNITLELTYLLQDNPPLYRVLHLVRVVRECRLSLSKDEAALRWRDLPEEFHDCEVSFPAHNTGHGVVIELTRLNVPCSRGYIHFSSLNLTQGQHYHNHKQAHLCGKLEELTEGDRHVYFPSSNSKPVMRLQGGPVFELAYRLVDYCYNVSFTARNGSYEMRPDAVELHCTFRIYMPYGQRVVLTLAIGNGQDSGATIPAPVSVNHPADTPCLGLLAELQDGPSSWSHCWLPDDSPSLIELASRQNRLLLRVSSRGAPPALRLSYRAEPVDAIAGSCGFGWMALKQFCVAAFETARLPWMQAEMECRRKGGHLVSIRSEHAQDLVDKMLMNSPGYRNDNSYWIGASDKIHEGDFRWSDGLPFSYENWFPGWSRDGRYYSRQPNDDGLSGEDCVEIRRAYSVPAAASPLAASFMWNDRDCATPNYYICERLLNDEPLEEGWPPDCNRTVVLSRQQPRLTISSPGFPRHYPDNADCLIDVSAPPGYRLILDFEELILENEPNCTYDYLEIIEQSGNENLIGTNQKNPKFCGDWSSKLKLLRHVSHGSKLKLRFKSDYSHHFTGFKARVSMENAMQCSDDRLHMFNSSCYLIVGYPEVTWPTAEQICRGMKAHLTSVLSPEEQQFVTSAIRRGPEYRTGTRYWLGARADGTGQPLRWVDGKPMSYRGVWKHQGNVEKSSGEGNRCLGVQWDSPSTPATASGFYWQEARCEGTGGYVCKKAHLIAGAGINFNKTINGTSGSLSTPNYPGNYYNDLDFLVRLTGPERSRLVVQFQRIDIEPQIECLYDYVHLQSMRGRHHLEDGIKWCGVHDSDMHRFNFVSESNELEVRFHSDYSTSGSGFYLTWHAVDVSACPLQTLTAKEGVVTTPNFPHFLLSHLNCTMTILAPVGKRIWLTFEHCDLGKTSNGRMNGQNDEVSLRLNLGRTSPTVRPFDTNDLLSEGSFVSEGEQLIIKLETGDHPKGAGFKAVYRIVNTVKEERLITLQNNSMGIILHLNYPDQPATNIDFQQHLVAPHGHIISLQLYHMRISEDHDCDGNGVIEITDNYADANTTRWLLCYESDMENVLTSVSPIAVTSYLHTLNLRQRSLTMGVPMNGSVRVLPDLGYYDKLLKLDNNIVEGCTPSPCLNGGKCIEKDGRKMCRCIGHFTGIFCAVTKCDLEPCVFGTCELTEEAYQCHCKTGYVGPLCDQKRRPCEGNPCESRGLCVERGDDSYICRCHAWWEGPKCERRMMRIPYKPLSERMLHEPFWLGLMTVFVVMGVIGLVWCAKRHFPEKIEKLLAEEGDRNRSTMSSLRSASVREQLAAASGAVSVNASASQTSGIGGGTSEGRTGDRSSQRSLFGRLGIRKPSILSLTSPHAHYPPTQAATARTFSLDDLLKPVARRTPSPKKKRNNSTPTKKNAAEKKQILQQLITPNNKQLSRKVSLGELIQMTERKPKDSENHNFSADEPKETKFFDNDPAHIALIDPKLEKKVTFARLLNKVSAEMSSGSEMELGIMQTNRLSCVFARPSSTPPSPGVDARSPHSTSSNQGSDSLTSSDLAIPSALSASISDLLGNRRHARLPNGRQKPTSADSILAMFRNFSSSSAAVNLSPSLRISPSTTPTASSPLDEIAGDDESSTSSVPTPVSFSSGCPESPVPPRNGTAQTTIEVPVLDTLSAQRAPQGAGLLHPPMVLLEIPSSISKCLSPIRELPTPLPSPALTPAMQRRSMPMVQMDDNDSDDHISVEIPMVSGSCSEDESHGGQDIAIDPQAEDGLILEEAAAMYQQQAAYKAKPRPPPLGQLGEQTFATLSVQQPNITISLPTPPPVIIPTLIVQTPSPTHPRLPQIILPGSPPPKHESCFRYPSPGKQSRKTLKEFDKPTSLDLPCTPPVITITCNMSEAESDAEALSPAVNTSGLRPSSGPGMSYLSPFSMGSRGEHTASESNLSSSGYSSMASPGPSRCGSSNPLCPSEMEDQGPSGSGGSHRRPSPLLRTSSNNSSNSGDNNNEGQHRGRSDSETLSDDPLVESNDEGIGTDHLEEKIEEGELKSAKELEVFVDTSKTVLDLNVIPLIPPPCTTKSASLEENMERLLPQQSNSKKSLQLPSIVVQCDSTSVDRLLDKPFSPMSSRSESPLSDRTTGLGRFSPMFYGRNKDMLPFTDSDGLYDFPSSDKVNIASTTSHRKSGKKREKKVLRNCRTPSPTKTVNPGILLEIPNKECFYKMPPPRKLSPKRRVTRSQVVSSSSSSDSITSNRNLKMSSSSPSPDTIRWSSPVEWLENEGMQTQSREAISDDINAAMLPKTEDFSKHQKLSRLRAISHQIRFLRRLELSLKRRDRTISPSDSVESGEDSPRATSPLLQHSCGSGPEIRKSSSIGRLPQISMQSGKTRRGKYKRGEPLLPQDEQHRRVIITGSAGHSD